MPSRPPRPCRNSRTGCSGLTTTREGFCPSCTTTRQQSYDEARGSSSSRGYGAAHRRWRKQVLAEWPICATLYQPDGSPVWDATRAELDSPAPGWRRCWKPSTDADHLITREDRPDLALDLSNGRGRCHTCHSRKTAMEDGRWARKSS